MSAAVQEVTVVVSESDVRGRPKRVGRGWEQAKDGGGAGGPRDLDLTVAAEREKNRARFTAEMREKNVEEGSDRRRPKAILLVRKKTSAARGRRDGKTREPKVVP
jgi:hypothetical protein